MGAKKLDAEQRFKRALELAKDQPEEIREQVIREATRLYLGATNKAAASDLSTAQDGGYPESLSSPAAQEKLVPRLSFDCKGLLDHFGVTDERRRRILTKIAYKAMEIDNGKGIPATESPDSYRFVRRGGPVPAPEAYFINGERHIAHPPIISRGSGPEMTSLWLEFEKLLLGVDAMERSLPPREERALEDEIAFSKEMREAGISWIEGVPDELRQGVPSITAETARQILAASRVFASPAAMDSLQKAPLSWMGRGGIFLEWFSTFIRENLETDQVFMGRLERFALARLLLSPIGSIERDLYRVAYPKDKRVPLKR